MHSRIKHYLDELKNHFDSIPVERKATLAKIAHYIDSKRKQGKPTNLVYVCTHNSRRSHFGQVWAKAISDYYGIEDIHTFSGGTEATAFNRNAIDALLRAGFEMKQMTHSENPVYHISHGDGEPSVCFSKVYNDSQNPQSEFAAIMTCSDAEENCPFIPGVELRIGTTYDDPKEFDNTPLQDRKYDERCKQIALETLYAFSLVH
nr:protein-tyrosine-phosphatase [uncultured Fluviicola sp.]